MIQTKDLLSLLLLIVAGELDNTLCEAPSTSSMLVTKALVLHGVGTNFEGQGVSWVR